LVFIAIDGSAWRRPTNTLGARATWFSKLQVGELTQLVFIAIDAA